MPQFHHGAMHVRLYRADIQVQKGPDFLQAQILVVPQRERRPLPRRKPFQGRFQTRLDLAGKIPVLRLGPDRRGQPQDSLFILLRRLAAARNATSASAAGPGRC